MIFLVLLVVVLGASGCDLPPTDEQACEDANGEWICEGRYCRCEVYTPREHDDSR